MNKRAVIQGFSVDLLTFDQVVDALFNRICENVNTHVVTINPEIIQSAKKNQELSAIIKNAEMVTADGVGIKLALRMKGILQEQVTGVDLSKAMLQKCAFNKIPVALVGAKPEVLQSAVSKIRVSNPEINIVYSHDGYFVNDAEILSDIKKSGAKFILVAMGSPKQEYFISELKKTLSGACMIGVGGTFDVLSGNVKRAPSLFTKLGLEWLYRTIKQPQRIKRIFPALPIFFFQSIIDSISRHDG